MLPKLKKKLSAPDYGWSDNKKKLGVSGKGSPWKENSPIQEN